ncbi:MAG: hypothetical protein JXR84_20055 [Anaerolineae bacterium]|nr:hypothetical protein [Anaerolineae bacterium]
MTETGFMRLLQALQRGPVMTEISPLALLCLPPEIDIASDAETLVERLDILEPHSERPILIPCIDTRYRHRFQVLNESLTYTPEAANEMLPRRLADARRLLLTHQRVAERIVSDTIQRGYCVVALLLVDGLSYEDARHWPEAPEPCLIDGPSITYNLTDQDEIVPTVGFPGIVGAPTLARRLVDVGVPHSTGFSYWRRERNEVSAYLFEGVPLTRVAGITTALETLEQQSLEGTYVQLVREGLDGLAHSRREVTPREIEAAVEAIHDNYRRLIEVVAATELPGVVYLTADHGILWKAQHPDLRLVEELHSAHPRYQRGGGALSDYGVELSLTGQMYTLYRYPYLGATIHANDSGVHGGLSYWESLVPFVRVEVNV